MHRLTERSPKNCGKLGYGIQLLKQVFPIVNRIIWINFKKMQFELSSTEIVNTNIRCDVM